MTTDELITLADKIRILGVRLSVLESLKKQVTDGKVLTGISNCFKIDIDLTKGGMLARCLVAGFDAEINSTKIEIEEKAQLMQPQIPKILGKKDSQITGGDWYDKQRSKPTGPARLINPFKGGRVSRERKPPTIIRDKPPDESNPLPTIDDNLPEKGTDAT
jgi:hypothetical protein